MHSESHVDAPAGQLADHVAANALRSSEDANILPLTLEIAQLSPAGVSQILIHHSETDAAGGAGHVAFVVGADALPSTQTSQSSMLRESWGLSFPVALRQ